MKLELAYQNWRCNRKRALPTKVKRTITIRTVSKTATWDPAKVEENMVPERKVPKVNGQRRYVLMTGTYVRPDHRVAWVTADGERIDISVADYLRARSRWAGPPTTPPGI
jgi:hypothetical protein